MDDRQRILEMLASGQITVEQATELLNALEAPARPDAPASPKSAAKMLRILVDKEDEAKVRVNVPAPLARFAMQFVPKETRRELEAQGINLNELLGVLKNEFPEGRLVDVEADEDGESVRVIIEVV